MTAASTLALIKKLAAAGLVDVLPHAEKRCRERHLTGADISWALENAVSSKRQLNGRVRVEGPSLDGESIPMIVSVVDGMVAVHTVLLGEIDEA